jgi:hypothetical protein
MLPKEPIDCVSLRRRNACRLSINAVNTASLSFEFDGVDVWAKSFNDVVKLQMPNEEVAADVRRMLASDPKSVFVVEVDPFGNDALTHDIVVLSPLSVSPS